MAMPRQQRSLNHHHHLLLRRFCFSLLFSSTFLSHVLASSTNEVALLNSWLHTSASPPPSALLNWNPLDPNPCNWSYITCASDNFVTEINIQNIELALPFPANLSSLAFLQKLVISGANLTGTIPDEIGDCISLSIIDVSSNNLVGSLPITIGKLQNLENLSLNDNQLDGKIPEEISNCTKLKNLLLFDNHFGGNLPLGLGKIESLITIRIGGNKDLDGEIPYEIGNCRNLQVLGLADTSISGLIPASLGRLSKLQVLSIYTTMLWGEIPPEIGNCSELVDLYLYENNLSGSLPKELGKLQKLQKMLLWQNGFVGPIPDEIGNCKSLVLADFSLNNLSGSIPWSFGNLSNLEELMMSNNNLSGPIPPVLANASSLIQLQLDTNQLTGSIPGELGLLKELTVFFGWQNKLEGSIPGGLAGCTSLQTLDLTRNLLTGSLPPSLFQLRNLTKLLLISNNISGPIPREIGNCSSLIRLRMASNRLSGQIPSEVGFLNRLNFLDLSSNNLSGPVPEEIGNCKEMQMLDLSNNTLSGNLPSSLFSLSALQVLDVSMNHFSGQIPDGVGQLAVLNKLVLSSNSFNGSIPSSLGNFTSLQSLDLSSNDLSGGIPLELFEIKFLDISLNLSWNALTGQIPPQISALNKLSVLDVSHNKLEGNVMALSELPNLVSVNISYNNFSGFLPDNKLFRQLSPNEVIGNQDLCPWGHASCFVDNSQGNGMPKAVDRRSWKLKLTIALLFVGTLVLAVLGLLAVFRLANMKKEANKNSEVIGSGTWSWQFTPFQKLNFTVNQVLKCLVESNVIGKGCSGVVYRAALDNGEVIAVKKLWPSTVSSGHDACQTDKNGASGGVRDSFSTEVKTLGSIRHKNIVKFLGCCWNHNTRLLMYEYMPNGSLGSLLHERNGSCLEWDLRYQIILGAAQGLAYLHHDCVPPIVHRDIKANNILVGLHFEAYIADFGLAKLVDSGDFGRSSNTLAGSYGYIAPEYGYMTKITEKSDVYSYGIVVLEVLTGKQPIDPTIPEGLHIVDWVKKMRGASMEVLDPGLRGRPEQEIEEMLQTLGVAILCVNFNPDDRPTMKDVAAMLKEIRQERDEEYAKVDMLVKDSQAENSVKENENQQDGGTSTAMEKMYLQSNNSSFSASSLLQSSSSIGFR